MHTQGGRLLPSWPWVGRGLAVCPHGVERFWLRKVMSDVSFPHAVERSGPPQMKPKSLNSVGERLIRHHFSYPISLNSVGERPSQEPIGSVYPHAVERYWLRKVMSDESFPHAVERFGPPAVCWPCFPTLLRDFGSEK